MKNEHDLFHNNNFDLIRLGTAMLVLLNHSFVHLHVPIPGWYTVVQQFQPVPMFFIMSGFLISASLERNKNLNQYFTNRFSRIFPALWMCVLLTLFIFSAFGGVDFFHIETVPWLIAQCVGFIYTPAFLDQFGYGSYNGSLWTLVVELQFYLILPVIFMVFRRLHLQSNLYFILLLVIAMVVAFLVRSPYLMAITSPAMQKIARYSLSSHAFLFIAGVLLQRYKVYRYSIVRGKAFYWGIAFLIFTYFIIPSPQGYMFSMLLLACFTISLAYTVPGLATKWLAKRDISYGIFLYHGIPLSLLVEWKFSGSLWYLVLVCGVTCLFAWFSFSFVESPAMDWAKKRNAVLTLVQKNKLPSPDKMVEHPL